MEAEPIVVQIVITRTKENSLKLTAHSKTEVIYNKEFDDESALFRHTLKDLVDELKVPS